MLDISLALLGLEEMDGEVTLLVLLFSTVVVMTSVSIRLSARDIVYLAVKLKDPLVRWTKFICMAV